MELLGSFDNSRPHRIQVNVARQLRQIFINFDKNRLVSPLKQMSGTLSFYVEIGGVRSVYVPHDLGEIAAGVSINR